MELCHHTASDSTSKEASSQEMKLESIIMILRPRFRDFNRNHSVLRRKGTPIEIQYQYDTVFDPDAIVQAEFTPRKAVVNSEYSKGLLENLRYDVSDRKFLRIIQLQNNFYLWLIL